MKSAYSQNVVLPAESEQFFGRLFPLLSGIESGAYHWQEQLFLEFVAGSYPPRVCVPTGLGKTSVMDVWLLALAWEATQRVKRTVPTRLVWVVDRRVVVDQATAEAESLERKLADDPQCGELRQALGNLCITNGSDATLAVSTLRGEFADNRKWSRDPFRPAIIVGTVDMVGSRLLFSGYGDSIRRRASHAGLLGQDALIVNDEAHLTPAFAAMLAQVSTRSGVRTVQLSATPREATTRSFPETLEDDLANPVFEKRYRAVKRLHLCKQEDAKKEILRLANEPGGRTLVFTRSPEDARKIAAAIESKHQGARPALLTGTQRGWERDKLFENAVVRRFRSKVSPDGAAEPCWLVATSAGEVGIDLSCDRLISDLDTADHLLQRFGRLNRFGETEGDAYVVYSPKQVSGEKGERLKATLDYLKTLPDVSAERLRMQPPPAEALSAAPHCAPLLPWHIDVWSMTSISSKDWPSRPAVEYWLRGEDEETSPPETYIAWRKDVEDLASAGVALADLEEVFDCYPVISQERLKAYTNGLPDALESGGYRDRPAILIGADGEIDAREKLGDLLGDERRLRYATLVLPPRVGYLDANGMVDWSRSTEKLTPEEMDRYDRSATPERGCRKFAPEEGIVAPDGFRQRYEVQMAGDDENEKGPKWVYFVAARSDKAPTYGPELLEIHRERVARLAGSLARRAGLDERLVRAFEWAGRWHDAGKNRDIWQRAVCNTVGSPPLAKSDPSKRFKPRLLDGYRHELGSLLDAEEQVPRELTPSERDLALHLVASHHGWARPHFPERTFDKVYYRRSEQASLECARRFGRLQRQYGAWRLAYLETLFRAADAIASASAPEFANA